jgi:hypothetical protein
MSNAYLNTILFGHSSASVNAAYMEALIPYMYTAEWVKAQVPQVQPQVPSVQGPNPSVQEAKPSVQAPNPPVEHKEPAVEQREFRTITREPRALKNTLFWAIYEQECPGEAFLNPYSINVEIETRVRVVDTLKKTPKRLKDTNSKLTQEATQALFGAMLTAKEDKLEFCVAYSVFFNKHILIVYPNTYRIFSPDISTEIEDDDHVIILHASKNGKTAAYKSEPNGSKQMADEIMRTHTAPLKPQSHYKTPELEAIAEKWFIPTRTIGNKRRKKEDVYNDIRLEIHNDQN